MIQNGDFYYLLILLLFCAFIFFGA